MKISETGFWENETAEGHGHDAGLAEAIAKFLVDEDAIEVFDFGCGTGYYSIKLKEAGITPLAVDGNPFTEQLVGNGILVYVKDLTKPIKLLPADWVISLEVGEHIPAVFEDNFINNLHNHNRYGMIVSWAVPGQGGDGHVNCKTNAEVMTKICAKGYDIDAFATQKLRDSAAAFPTPCYWFKDTLMVFRKEKV